MSYTHTIEAHGENRATTAMRIHKHATLLALLLSIYLVPSRGSQAAELRITQFPEAVYATEPATFVANGTPGNKVRVVLDTTKLAEAVLKDGHCEINLTLTQPGLLRFESGSASTTFDLIAPTYNGAIRETDGYLFTDNAPAILLTEHRHPPKHNRRWELLKILKGVFVDTRPQVTSIRFIGSIFSSTSVGNVLTDATGLAPSACRFVAPKTAFYEINALIASARNPAAADVTLVGLGACDLERGIAVLTYAQKVEWYLQALTANASPHLHLICPRFTPREERRYKDVIARLTLSALGNDALLVSLATLPGAAGETAPAWAEQILKDITRKVRFQ